MSYNLISQQMQMESMFENAGQHSPLTRKRKELMDSSLDTPGIQKLVTNNRVAQMEHRSWLHQASSPKKLPAQLQPQSTFSASGSPHPQAQLKRSMPTKAGPQQSSAQKNQSGQPSPKHQSESSESVRSKLRESLGVALALVSQGQDKSSSAGGSSQTSAGDGGVFSQASEEKKESFLDKADNTEIQNSASDGLYVTDELLQGNGLSWVLESDMGFAEKVAQAAEEQPDLCGGQQTDPPEIVASKIEAELYKLYGGINKKYKEKGRSLLFNLKDRNNPELRERVMSGDIAPDRLCAMSAEELASKELSEWRMAKAEELAQMVVLPDSDGDMRRLVKKTHKGEFQVEVEPEDSISAEVAVAASSVTQPKTMEKKNRGNRTGEKSSSEDRNVIMIPSSDGNDSMQGLTVDDELKDAEFLPPIVSLDEFMESLNAEPPFENLPVDAEKATPVPDKDDSRVGSDSKSPDVDNSGKTKWHSDEISAELSVKSETAPVSITKNELVWEGLLQMNLSASASVMGIFKSGEKAFAKAWPGLVEIKGRVRLDAFEKFLQGLPMSRSRAVMAVQFICKEGSVSENASLKEVAVSYVVDERVGFAEPASGVELYVCPPDSKTQEMLSKIFPKDQLEALNSIDNGLIGVIVWRKPHVTSTISPDNKYNSKNQFSTPRGNLDKDLSLNMNITLKSKPYSFCNPNEDDDDVPPGFGPPGGATWDEDDLPEFNFSTGSVTPRQRPTKISVAQPNHAHSQLVPRPIDQMRELIHKYGQPENKNPRSLWNDDDDDDMPEWHPGDAKLQPQALPTQNRFQQIAPNQQTLNWRPQEKVIRTEAASLEQQGQRMVPNSAHGYGFPAYQPNSGKPWRRNAPSSRRF